VWVFDVAWALAVFFGLRSGAARLLAVRIGTPAALGCGVLGLGAGLGLQRAVAGDSSGVAPYATLAARVHALEFAAPVAGGALACRPCRPLPRHPLARRPLRPRPTHGLPSCSRAGRDRRRAARRAAGRRRHLRQVRPAALGAHRSRPGGNRARAVEPARRRDTVADGRRARGHRTRARRARRRAVRCIRPAPAGGGVDRPGAPRPLTRRRRGCRQGSAAGHRRAGRARPRHPPPVGVRG
jgi:hypothetical protein